MKSSVRVHARGLILGFARAYLVGCSSTLGDSVANTSGPFELQPHCLALVGF